MLIGLCGYAQSGKDEFAAALTGDNAFKRVAFADEVKKDCQAFIDSKFPGMFDVINNPNHKKLWRKLLVGWGDSARVTDIDYWIRRLVKANLTLFGREREHHIIVTDVRYLNEAQWVVNEKDGMLVRIHRVGITPNNDTEAATIAEIDASDLPRFDFYNEGNGLDKYTKAVRDFVKENLAYV